MRIVVVEDEDRARNGIKKLIRDMLDERTIIGTARNGREGMALISEVKPDVVISDIRMPFLDGIEMIERLQVSGCSSLFVIITGHADFKYAQKAVKLGVTDYLLKPITRAEFQKLIDKLERCFLDTGRQRAPEKTSDSPKQNIASRSSAVNYVLRIITEKYFQPISLEGLADELRLTPEYLSGLFHRETGETFTGYLKRRRIEKAKELLLKDSMLVSEVASAVGYANGRYFCRVFKEQTGMPASEFVRRRLIGIADNSSTTK